MTQTADILVLVAHPALEQSHANRRLMRAAQAVGERVMVRDLYALYPDYLIDVAAEQAALAAARLVVWQHPIHWYGMTPLMKLWVDEVLSFGWAYGEGGSALADKHLWLVASTGGPADSYHPQSYNRYFFDAFLPPYEQTAVLCGMRFIEPLLLHGAQQASNTEIDALANLYADRLRSFPDWPELDDAAPCVACEVPAAQRPRPDDAAGDPGRADRSAAGKAPAAEVADRSAADVGATADEAPAEQADGRAVEPAAARRAARQAA